MVSVVVEEVVQVAVQDTVAGLEPVVVWGVVVLVGLEVVEVVVVVEVLAEGLAMGLDLVLVVVWGAGLVVQEASEVEEDLVGEVAVVWVVVQERVADLVPVVV